MKKLDITPATEAKSIILQAILEAIRTHDDQRDDWQRGTEHAKVKRSLLRFYNQLADRWEKYFSHIERYRG